MLSALKARRPPKQNKRYMGIIADVNYHEQNEKEYIEIVVPKYSHGVSFKGVY